MSLEMIVEALSGGDSSSANVLLECNVELGGTAFEVFCLSIDEKRLYDERIGELFQLCGNDVKRFVYHIDIELPNQETGDWRMAGPFAMRCRRAPGFSEARQFGQPGSFWALESPPDNPYYKYPIF